MEFYEKKVDYADIEKTYQNLNEGMDPNHYEVLGQEIIKNLKTYGLEELENYITNNKHLPGIISAREVEEYGNVDLGEMNTKLLKKIEELTLYIIDLQKQIDELKK